MTRRIHLSLDGAARLRGALDADHLSDEELVLLTFDEVPQQERQQMDVHLASCVSCRDELEQTRATADELRSEEARPSIDRLWDGFVKVAGGRRRMPAWNAMFGILAPTWQTTRGTGASWARAVAEGSDSDGRLRWVLTEEGSGHLRAVIIGAAGDFPSGTSVVINTSPERVVPIVERDGGAYAEFELRKDEWRRISKRSLVTRIVLPHGAVIEPGSSRD